MPVEAGSRQQAAGSRQQATSGTARGSRIAPLLLTTTTARTVTFALRTHTHALLRFFFPQTHPWLFYGFANLVYSLQIRTRGCGCARTKTRTASIVWSDVFVPPTVIWEGPLEE